MTISIFLITLLIFLDNLGYAIYEIKEKNNKLGGISVIAISTIMIFFVNYAMITFK